MARIVQLIALDNLRPMKGGGKSHKGGLESDIIKLKVSLGKL